VKTRCPACGSTNSLDSLMAHQDASGAIAATFKLNGKLGRALVMYLGLFRSGTRELSFDRVSKLLTEIQPDIERQAITRDRIEYPAPAAAWIYAIEQTIHARDTGKLVLPLKTHGFLYTIITQFRPEMHAATHAEFSSSTPVTKRQIKLTPAQEKLEAQINATTTRLKGASN
jgi:hypothetical protein